MGVKKSTVWTIAISGLSRYTPASSLVSKPTSTFGSVGRGKRRKTESSNPGLSFAAQPAALTMAVSFTDWAKPHLAVKPLDYNDVPRFVLAHHATWAWLTFRFVRLNLAAWRGVHFACYAQDVMLQLCAEDPQKRSRLSGGGFSGVKPTVSSSSAAERIRRMWTSGRLVRRKSRHAVSTSPLQLYMDLMTRNSVSNEPGTRIARFLFRFAPCIAGRAEYGRHLLPLHHFPRSRFSRRKRRNTPAAPRSSGPRG